LDVANGMAYLHSHNIYHRDLKPDNMLVVAAHSDAQCNLKITDFGTSRYAGKHRTGEPNPIYDSPATLSNSKSSSNSVSSYSRTPSTVGGQADSKAQETREQLKLTKGVGTLVYQAPEILEGKVDYDVSKTDVYSFGVLLWQIFTQVEPFSEPPYDKFIRWEIENFVVGKNRLKIPDEVPKKAKELIQKSWHHDASKRPIFKDIVITLTQLMKECPADSPSPAPSPKPVPDAPVVPRPPGNTDRIGWSDDISRPEAEAKLRDKPVGTFLIRWSHNMKSYVLSYVSDSSPPFQHIGFIKPVGRDMKIEVSKEDKSRQKYEDIYVYCDAMKETGVIKEPLGAPKPIAEDTYGFSFSSSTRKG